MGLAHELMEIRRANRRSWWAPGCQAVCVHAFAQWAKAQPAPLQWPLRALAHALFIFVRNVYGIELPAPVRVGRRFQIAHQGGIVVHPQVVFGDDCAIRQNVTIGAARVGPDRRGREFNDDHPVFGDRVVIGAGAVVVGPIRIGDDVKIGPNAVVRTDVPSGATIVAPDSVLLQRGTGDHLHPGRCDRNRRVDGAAD